MTKKKVERKSMLWNYYKIEMEFNKERASNRVMGGVNRNLEQVDDWINFKKMKDAKYKDKIEAQKERIALGEDIPEHELLRSVEDIKKEVVDNTDAILERVAVGFLGSDTDPNKAKGILGIYAREHHIKAHFKDCANQIKDAIGESALRSKVANKVYYLHEINYFKRDGEYIKVPDGVYQHPIQVQTAKGPKSALKINEFIERPTLTFAIKVLRDNVIDLDLLEAILEYGAEHGMFSERGLGYGKYNYKIEEVSKEEGLKVQPFLDKKAFENVGIELKQEE